MPPKKRNQNLQAAKAGKKDEFYTQLTDLQLLCRKDNQRNGGR